MPTPWITKLNSESSTKTEFPASLALILFFERLLASQNPVDCFGCQPVERHHRYLEMFFACILDFIVADPAKRLHKHHHCRNARARNLSSVVQRAGRHAMGCARYFANGLLTKIQKCRMKWNRFDAPDARPLHGTFFLFGETPAGILR